MHKFVTIYTTFSDMNAARRLGRRALEERLVACVNIIPGIVSLYHWQGEIADDDEFLMLMKTRAELVDQLKKLFETEHSYSVPAFTVLPIVDISESYATWLLAETRAVEQD